MLRAAVVDVVRPLVEKIAEQLADELVGHLEVRIEHALQAARAALAQTELPWAFTEVRFEPAPVPTPPVVAENVCEHGDHPAPAGKRFCSRACLACEAATVTDPKAECAGLCSAKASGSEVAESSSGTPPLAPPADETPPSAGGDAAGKRHQVCSKCGALGVNARSCGKTHNISTTSAPIRDADPQRTPPVLSPAVDRQSTPALSPYQPLAPVEGKPLRDLPSTPAAIERRRLRATPEALIARGVKANPEAQAEIVGAAPLVDNPQPIVPELPVPIATFRF